MKTSTSNSLSRAECSRASSDCDVSVDISSGLSITFTPYSDTTDAISLESVDTQVSSTLDCFDVDGDGILSQEIEVCVGSFVWSGEYTTVPVMGTDGTRWTVGYMHEGDLPKFKIYDASENLYYTAESSEISGWSSNGMPIAELLSANVSIPGCTDPDFCNYDSFATGIRCLQQLRCNDGVLHPSHRLCC